MHVVGDRSATLAIDSGLASDDGGGPSTSLAMTDVFVSRSINAIKARDYTRLSRHA